MYPRPFQSLYFSSCPPSSAPYSLPLTTLIFPSFSVIVLHFLLTLTYLAIYVGLLLKLFTFHFMPFFGVEPLCSLSLFFVWSFHCYVVNFLDVCFTLTFPFALSIMVTLSLNFILLFRPGLRILFFSLSPIYVVSLLEVALSFTVISYTTCYRFFFFTTHS